LEFSSSRETHFDFAGGLENVAYIHAVGYVLLVVT
jgi:hypothetical protein